AGCLLRVDAPMQLSVFRVPCRLFSCDQLVSAGVAVGDGLCAFIALNAEARCQVSIGCINVALQFFVRRVPRRPFACDQLVSAGVAGSDGLRAGCLLRVDAPMQLSVFRVPCRLFSCDQLVSAGVAVG
ncbi:hypothetical protein, partial [Xenorhabdus entomophaga]|uniref:hypothetical protein n=1 Tax=Xenorhabdus entomophaga TaxID=3136257 RepID=UPI0030F413C7